MPFSAGDFEFMARALRLAERGLYTTTPNPRVGCVLVNDGRVVGEGWHERAGVAHAEVAALKAAGAAAAGATAYVSLEPCAHHGRTPPCSDAGPESAGCRSRPAEASRRGHRGGDRVDGRAGAGTQHRFRLAHDAWTAVDAGKDRGQPRRQNG